MSDDSWRYENPGFAGLLTISGTTVKCDETQSKTGYAFYQTARKACFNIPTTSKEIWVKFDVYCKDGTSQRWRAYNEEKAHYADGITLYNGCINIWSIENLDSETSSHAVVYSGLHTVILHMVSSGSNGMIEFFYDGVKADGVVGNNLIS